jgi:NADH dehydrogenase
MQHIGSGRSLATEYNDLYDGIACTSKLVNHEQKRHVSSAELDKYRDTRERIVILGSGWAGYTLSKEIDHKKYQVVIVSPRSYFVFTPLLASTSVGTLEFRTAVEPIRSRRNRSSFIQGYADDVDLFNKSVTIEEAVSDPQQGFAQTGARHAGKDAGQIQSETERKVRSGQLFDLKYDKLIIAVGCYNQTFDVKGVKEHANFLKDVGDARAIRKRLLECFESAALPTTPDEVRRQILHFAVVGGGPTGIEFAAELFDLIHEDLKRIYPGLVRFTRISIYDVSSSVLSQFDDKLAAFAAQHFKRRGIEIKTSRAIQELSPGLPHVNQSLQSARLGFTLKVKDEIDEGVGMCIWSTGLMMNPFIKKALTSIRKFPPNEVIFKSKVEDALQLQWHIMRDSKTGSIVTNDRLRVLITPDGPHGPMKAHLRDVFAIGDCSIIEGTQYPATAQVANQKAQWLAKRLNKNDLYGETSRFRFKNLGIMAYLGGAKAIFEGGKGVGNISGRTAWLIWRVSQQHASSSFETVLTSFLGRLSRQINIMAKSNSYTYVLVSVTHPDMWSSASHRLTHARFLNWAFGRDISRF